MYIEQDRQGTYNVVLRRVRVTIVVVGKQTLLHIMSVCLYPEVPRMQCEYDLIFCYFWRVYLTKFTNIIEHKMCVLILSTNCARNISHSKTN